MTRIPKTAQPSPYEAMSGAERVRRAKKEHAALKAWQMAGGDDPRPETPVLDWMSATDATARAAKKATPQRKRGPRVTEDQVRAAIQEVGPGYTKVVKLLRGQGYPLSGWFRSMYEDVLAGVDPQPPAPQPKARRPKAAPQPDVTPIPKRRRKVTVSA